MARLCLGVDGTHRDKVRRLFDKIAPRYDFINDLQSFGLRRFWKRRLVAMAAAQPGTRALDVCCGTGDIAFALAQSGAEVTGLDFSPPMLEIARCRQSAFPKAKLNFMSGDAMRLPFADASFEVVSCGYGLRNLEDWRTGLREMHRVLRSGGRLLVLDFGKPDNRVWRAVYFAYLRFVVPVFGKLFCGDSAAYAYILKSLHAFPAQHGVDAALRESGCESVGLKPLLGGVMAINYGEKGK